MNNKNCCRTIQHPQLPSTSTPTTAAAFAVAAGCTNVQQWPKFHSELQQSSAKLGVLNLYTDAVRFWKLELTGTYQPHKSVELSQNSSCTRHNPPHKYLENCYIACVTAVAPRLLQPTLFTLLHLTGLPVLVGGCSTRSRYEPKKLVPSQKFAELEDCTGAYWGYCRNSGICKMTTDISQRVVPICSCPAGYRGRQCELINDPNIYFSRQQGQMEMAAMSGFVVAIIFVILFASFVLYLYRRYMKYGMHGSSSLTTLETLELSPAKQRRHQNSDQNVIDVEASQKTTVEKYPIEPSSLHPQQQFVRATYPPTFFQLFTLAEYPGDELLCMQSKNSHYMTKKN